MKSNYSKATLKHDLITRAETFHAGEQVYYKKDAFLRTYDICAVENPTRYATEVDEDDLDF